MRSGDQELYDHTQDPHEWHNLAGDDKHAPVIAKLRQSLPTEEAKPVIGDWQKWEIEAWRKAEALGK